MVDEETLPSQQPSAASRMRLGTRLVTAIAISAAIGGCGDGQSGKTGGKGTAGIATVASAQVSRAEFDQAVRFEAFQATSRMAQRRLLGSPHPAVIDTLHGVDGCAKTTVTWSPGVSLQARRERCRRLIDNVQKAALRDVLQRRITAAEAHAARISVPPSAFDREWMPFLDLTIEGRKNEKKFHALTGLDSAFLRGMAQDEFLFARLQERVLDRVDMRVTERDLRTAYAARRADITMPETRKVRAVITDSQRKAGRAKRALQKGQSLPQVVARYSTDPTNRQAQGIVNPITKTFPIPAIRNAIFGGRDGAIVGPIAVSGRYFVFQLGTRIPAKITPLKEVRRKLTREIVTRRQEAATKAWGADILRRWRPQVKCNAPVTIDLCGAEPSGSTT